MTGGCGKQQPLAHLQKAVIKVSLVVILIIADLHQATKLSLLSACDSFGVGGKGKEECPSAITVIAVKKESTCCVPWWAGADRAHATLSGMVLVQDDGESVVVAGIISLWA